MLLQIVTLSLDVRHARLPIGKLHTGDLTLGRVGFLGFGNEDLRANALLLWRVVEERGLGVVSALVRLFPPHRLVHCCESWAGGME